ncbi:Uridine kinase|nr:Uridine kinase [Candidatus Pantoea persica]
MTDKFHQCVIVGIAGASASGKSLIASTPYREIRDQVGDAHIGVPGNAYYKDQSHLTMEERAKTNYDHPSSMDHDLLLQHLQALKAGQDIDLPVYSYVEHTRTRDSIHLKPKKVIILEGILLLTDARLRQELNFSIFVDTRLDICLMRLMKRDVNERGRSNGLGDEPVPENGAPDVPAVYRAVEAVRGYYRAARWKKPHRH